MSVCGHKRCHRKATQGWDVGSWFKPRTAQNLTHYEVCDRHAEYFAGSFDRQASERVARNLRPWDASPNGDHHRPQVTEQQITASSSCDPIARTEATG